MMDRFNELAPRDQAVLVAGVLLVALIIGWSFVWTPLRDGVRELDATVTEKSRLVVDLQRAASLGGSPGSARSAPGQSMLLLVDQTARAFGLAGNFERRQQDPSNPNVYNVTFRNAPFNTLVQWLIELERMHGVRVDSTNVSGAREPGLVDGQVRLDRS